VPQRRRRGTSSKEPARKRLWTRHLVRPPSMGVAHIGCHSLSSKLRDNGSRNRLKRLNIHKNTLYRTKRVIIVLSTNLKVAIEALLARIAAIDQIHRSSVPTRPVTTSLRKQFWTLTVPTGQSSSKTGA
jgi:hypothetical protein